MPKRTSPETKKTPRGPQRRRPLVQTPQERRLRRKPRDFWRAMTMALSRAEKYLIDGLKICAVPKGMSAAIFMTLQTDEQMWEMCEHLSEHRDATAEELLNKAREIAQKDTAQE